MTTEKNAQHEKSQKSSPIKPGTPMPPKKTVLQEKSGKPAAGIKK
ncbi:MAG: hypothetical protein RLN76_05895 [Phycisphaeraceae bacterium]